MADKALQKVHAQPRAPRRGQSREGAVRAARAAGEGTLPDASRRSRRRSTRKRRRRLISAQRSMSAKNLGGIEVPDGARLVLKFPRAAPRGRRESAAERRRSPGADRRPRLRVDHPVRRERSHRRRLVRRHAARGRLASQERASRRWRHRRRSARRTCASSSSGWSPDGSPAPLQVEATAAV